jgi:hypothetical protein
MAVIITVSTGPLENTAAQAQIHGEKYLKTAEGRLAGADGGENNLKLW